GTLSSDKLATFRSFLAATRPALLALARRSRNEAPAVWCTDELSKAQDGPVPWATVPGLKTVIYALRSALQRPAATAPYVALGYWHELLHHVRYPDDKGPYNTDTFLAGAFNGRAIITAAVNHYIHVGLRNGDHGYFRKFFVAYDVY